MELLHILQGRQRRDVRNAVAGEDELDELVAVRLEGKLFGLLEVQLLQLLADRLGLLGGRQGGNLFDPGLIDLFLGRRSEEGSGKD